MMGDRRDLESILQNVIKGVRKILWSEVEETYGKELADKMKKSEMLCGITVTIRNGEFDIPESDIRLAYKDVMNIPIHPMRYINKIIKK